MDKFEFRAMQEEAGIIMFGRSPYHFDVMTLLNQYLEEDVIEIRGSGIGVNLLLPRRHFDLWSNKVGEVKEFWDDETDGGSGDRLYCLRLDKIREKMNEK